MHFLCLHGVGTNSEILEMQTTALRFELGDNHTYEFVDGTVPWPADPAIRSMFAADDDSCYAYFDPSSAESCRTALDQLETYLESEGPYDGVLAFSQGAAMVATLLIRAALQDDPKKPQKARLSGDLKCVVFFSGGLPADPDALQQGKVCLMTPSTATEKITIPAANVWGASDPLSPRTSAELSKMCKAESSTVFVHNGGHEVPGSKSKEALLGAVHAMRRTIERALLEQ